MAKTIKKSNKEELDEFGLNLKQREFCKHYLNGCNAGQAIKKAGYNYSDNAAYVHGSKLLRNAKIEKYLDYLLSLRKDEAKITHERITEEFAKIAFSDITELFEVIEESLDKTSVKTNKEGKVKSFELKSLKDFPKNLRFAIKSIEPTRYGVKITLYDKIGALEALGKHTGYFAADNEQKKPEGVQIYLPDNGRNQDQAGELAPES